MKTRNIFLSLAVVVGIGISAQAQTYISHSVNQPPLLVADAGPAQTFCLGDSLMLGGNPTAMGGTAAYQYQWTPSTGLFPATAANPLAFLTASATYLLQVTDTENCSDTAQVTVTLVIPSASFSSTTNLLQADFTDQSTSGTAWQWDFGDGATSTQQNPSHTYANPGSYLVCLTINPGTNCVASFCDSVTVIAVGVSPTLSSATVRAYPNPVTGNEMAFQVTGASLSGSIDIRLNDVQGREVLQYSGPASQTEHRLSRRALAAGTYGYRVSVAEGILGTGKVVLR